MNTKRPGKYLLLCGLLWLAGCGNTGSNGTGSPLPMAMVASGPLTSLGPLGVAGTHLDDAGTQVLLNSTAARQAGDLRLGMFADADGVVTPSTADGTAATTVAQSLVLGPVTSIDPASRRLHVVGLPARADRNTLLEGIDSLDQLALGDWVEVFGLRLPGSEGTLATRIVAHTPSVDGSVEVLGSVSEVGTSSITTQGLRIDLASAQVGLAAPAGVQLAPPGAATLIAGALVRVQGTYDRASGNVTATLVTTGFAPARSEGKLVYLEGFVLEQSAATRIRVGDLAVDTTDIATPLAVGQRISVRGLMQGGTLRADRVAVMAPEAQIEFVVEGPISSFRSLSDFSVRGERIDASQAVVSGGDASSLGQGLRVRVKGVAGPGRLNATEVAILG